jgi:hypothetical protein
MPSSSAPITFEKSARQDVRWWMLLLVGSVFTYGGLTIDPQTNCSSDGDCAPWLVQVAAVMGIIALSLALGLLIRNGRRGSLVDVEKGTLAWWQGRRTGHGGEGGEIPLKSIATVKVIRESDSDSIHFYGEDGARLPLPDGEIIPWPYDDWASQLTERAPHIRLIVEDR